MSIATLKALAAQATAGPWNTGPSIDAELIAAMRNSIDALLAVAEAAQNMVGVMECDDDLSQAFCCPDGCCFKALRAALARLEA